MNVRTLLMAAAAAGLIAIPAAQAQEAVMGVPNAEALFHSKNPKLDRNKQAAYHIEKELLECGEWNRAGEWLTQAYHQHNPNAKSGLPGVVYFFTQVLKVKAKPCPEKMKSPVVAVIAEGDYVTVMTPRSYKDPKDPSKSYFTTWFDTWRFVDGKADEHWDPAQKM
jgi:predicted SnoaL-like aldol condensation-catalyzing enzyme